MSNLETNMGNFDCEECGDPLPNGDSRIFKAFLATSQWRCLDCLIGPFIETPVRERSNAFVRVSLLAYRPDFPTNEGFMTCVEWVSGGGVIENDFFEPTNLQDALDEFARLERAYLYI